MTRTAVAAAGLGSHAEEVVMQFEACWDGWAAALDVVCAQGASVLGRWIVVYTAPDGTAASHVRHGSTSIANACVDQAHPGNIVGDRYSALTHIEAPQRFDFDGDGAPEILLADRHPTITDHPEAGGDSLGSERTSELLTFKRRVVSPYAPALALRGVATNGIERMRDVDGDGRPDLEITFAANVPRSVPRRIAHSLADGAFSETDAVARRALLAQCPATEDLLVLRADRSIDNETSFASIACAALRGELGRDIMKRLAALCTGRSLDCLEVERWAGVMYLYGVGAM